MTARSRARATRMRRLKRVFDQFGRRFGKRAPWLLADVARAGQIGIDMQRRRESNDAP